MCRWLKNKPKGIHRVLHSAAAIRRRNIMCGRAEAIPHRLRLFAEAHWISGLLQYRRNHLPIGSGVTEAACKTVFTQRLKQSGMTWKLEGGQWIVDLRVIHLSGLWPQVFQAYLQAKPPEMGTHDGLLEAQAQKIA